MVQGAISFKPCKVHGCHVPDVAHGAKKILHRVYGFPMPLTAG